MLCDCGLGGRDLSSEREHRLALLESTLAGIREKLHLTVPPAKGIAEFKVPFR